MEFGNLTDKGEIIKLISELKHTPGETFAVAGIKLATRVNPQFQSFANYLSNKFHSY